MKKVHVAKFLDTMQSSMAASGLSGRSDIAAFTLGNESFAGADRDQAKSGLDSLLSILDNSLAAALSNETFSDAQINAAQRIAGLAMDPAGFYKSASHLTATPISGDGVVVSAESWGLNDIVPSSVLSAEAFDGQSMKNSIYFSIVFNLGAATQDDFGEAFFPTITMDPTVSGFKIETEYPSLMTEFNRGVTGAAEAGKFNRTPIVKAMYDNSFFGVDRTRLVPYFRDENKGLLVEALKFVDESNGTATETAPLQFGKQINILGISQSDAQIARGVMDNTDALDRAISLDKIFFSMTGTVGSDDVTEYFSVPVAMFPHSNFTYAPQEHNKDVRLAFTSDGVIIDTRSTKTAAGAVSSVLGALPANHKIRLEMRVHGDGNTMTGDVGLYGSSFEIVEVRNAAGDLIAKTSSEYATIISAVKALKLEGYTLTAFATNSNLRTRGTIITSDAYTQEYVVPLRSGVNVLMPVNNATGTDNDASKVVNQIHAVNIKTSVYAVNTLVDTADMLHNVTANGLTGSMQLLGIGRHHVTPFYGEESIDLSMYVDSASSGERADDIRMAIVNKIKNQVLRMYTESNYVTANKALNGMNSKVVDVIIGTDPELESWLTKDGEDIDLGSKFKARIVSTPNPRIKGKIFMTFGVFDEQRNVTPNPLNFGQMAWAPTISTDVIRSVGAGTVRELSAVPRFLHIVNLPILSMFTVTDINNVLGKVIGYRQNI